MAISFKIGGVPVVMTKFFSESDVDSVLELVPEGARQVFFVDTPSTEHLHALVRELVGRGTEVVVRDHHDIANPRNEREEAIASAAALVRAEASDAIISTRDEHPACSSLVGVGEFADVDLVVADPDPDGLTAAMKALGVVYPELDADAAVLDGPRSEQTAENLSALAVFLVKGMATLPPFNPKNPSVAEKAKADLFSTFVSAVEGDSEARVSLEARVEEYEAGVKVAEELVSKATEVAPGVVMVDTVGSPRYDLATLTRGLECGAKVTVVRKDNGPIASAHGGVQVSLAVVREHQQEINLQELLPEGFSSDPEAGIISNTTFLLHVSEKVWEESVLPALRECLA